MVSSKQKKDQNQSIGYFQLFRFATTNEQIMILMGFILTAIKSLSMPCIIIIYSEFISMLVDRSYQHGTTSKTIFLPIIGGGKILTNATMEENNIELYNDSMAYGILFFSFSLVFFVAGIFAVDLLNYSALSQVTRMRINYFKAVLRQDIGWHDLQTNQNFGLRITDEIEKIRDGISEKLSHFINLLIGFVVMIILSFVYGWKLTLAISVYIPIVIFTNSFVTKHQNKLTAKELDSYASGGSLVEEVLNGIRTVVAFNGQKYEEKRYAELLVPARRAGQKKGAFTGIGEGIARGLLFISCAVAFWYGVNLILADREKEDKEYTPAIMMIAFIGIIVGADNVSRSTPFLEAFAMATTAARTIFSVIDSESKIDPLSKEGIILKTDVMGNVEFQDVFFRYPSREDIIVLRGINIKVESGTTVALVGHSGCGKSTCIQLMQRFYDPVFGQICLDGLDIKKYNISWLRSNIAIVGQEPVLFQGTIGENIGFGKPEATQKEIEEAAKGAGVHEFVTELPESYGTWIGEKGVQLSGGQKQRIAIARALVQNPKILLLDEATSALDYESEKLVQEALDKASKRRTTIVVSHRLSAIKGADKIVFIDHGKVLEEGSHEELMKLNGSYNKMVSTAEHDDKPDNTTLPDNLNKETLEIYKKSFELDVNNLRHDLEKKHSLKLETIPLPELKKTDTDEVKESSVKYLKTFIRILGLCKPEWFYLLFGGVCACLVGCSYPVLTLAFAEFYASLAVENENEALDRTGLVSIACLVAGILTTLICFIQIFLFNLSGVWLTSRLRIQAFKSILQQNMSWFDNERNSVGSLSARLAGDAAVVQGATGYPLSGILQACSTFVLSVSIAFRYSWKLALLCLSMTPFIVGSIIFEANYMASRAIAEKEILEQASRVATEAIANLRTVAGLRREQQLIDSYTIQVKKVQTIMRQKLRLRGIVNSCGQSLMYFGYAFALAYGGVLVSQGDMEFQDILKVSETLLYGAMMLAQSLAFVPAFTGALIAGHRLFEIIDRKTEIQSPERTDKNTAISNQFFGVRYQNIQFTYPSRQEIQILKDFNLEVLIGKTVALVGHSGCGKSTCIQLLQRYYDPDDGKIQIEQGNIRTDMSLENLRSKLGIVSQEPVLFERTIAENIAYGDNSREVSLDEVMDAAKQANAHSFIISLPLGYETRLGARGTQLSGGEKQRIAISRALVRNPKILLLDEATSALDLQSEQIVQSALDMACSGRTCIVIAHRLSTIQNADMICVFQNGKIVEQGTHQQLLAKTGIYYKLYKTQPQL